MSEEVKSEVKEEVKTKVEIQIPDYVKRMSEELNVLKEKIEKCKKFTEGEEFKKLGDSRASLMMAQLSAMVAYANILSIRLNIEFSIVYNDTMKKNG